MARNDYCNGLLCGVPAVHPSKLQRLQIPQRHLFITHTPRYCHITPVLLALHWLPVKFRIWYKISVISLKVFYNLGPTYLSNLINIKRCSRYNLRSNKVGAILQDPTAKFKCTLGDRSLLLLLKRYGTVYRTILGMILHKRLIIKTHYFKEAYSDLP